MPNNSDKLSLFRTQRSTGFSDIGLNNQNVLKGTSLSSNFSSKLTNSQARFTSGNLTNFNGGTQKPQGMIVGASQNGGLSYVDWKDELTGEIHCDALVSTNDASEWLDELNWTY